MGFFSLKVGVKVAPRSSLEPIIGEQFSQLARKQLT